jgi:ubiquinone/menaquinone biosynthesis C-methylase UbiE
MVLEPPDARIFYDRFGKRQDTQSFYEDPALDDLIAHAHFDEAGKIFEFGCGTGRFATRLVSEQLASSATYLGCDLSSTMVRLATERLAALADRAQVLHCDGTVRFPVPNNSVDRVVSTYVLDLLSEMDIGKFLQEAYRVLDVGGKLCLVSLTTGTTFLSRIVSAVWASIHRSHASLVGGCRPIRLRQYVNPAHWELEYGNVVVAYGVPSEVLVAHAKHSAQQSSSTTRWAIAHPLDIQATSPRVPVPQGRPSLRGGTNW